MKYAIIESGGKQYRAVEGGTLDVDRLPVEAGKNVKLEQVLLLADGDNVTVGTPLVKGSPVWATVVEHFRGPKVNNFLYSPKKRIRVKIGHRQNYTRLLVEQIGGSALIKKEPAKAEEVEVVEEEAPKKAAPARKPAAKAETKEAPKEKKAAAPKKAAPAAEKKTTARKPAASKTKKADEK